MAAPDLVDLLVASAFGLDPAVLADVEVVDSARPALKAADVADRAERRQTYHAEILRAVAEGCVTLASIGPRLGIARTTLRVAIRPLVEGGYLVERPTSVRVRQGRPKYEYALPSREGST